MPLETIFCDFDRFMVRKVRDKNSVLWIAKCILAQVWQKRCLGADFELRFVCQQLLSKPFSSFFLQYIFSHVSSTSIKMCWVHSLLHFITSFHYQHIALWKYKRHKIMAIYVINATKCQTFNVIVNTVFRFSFMSSRINVQFCQTHSNET